MSIKHLLKLKPVRQFAIFCGLFELGMLLSITTMPLYFRQENAVAAYSIAYAVMAITGVFSFIYGLVVDRLGASNSLLIGILLYGLALSARVFTSPIIAILVAILAGMGASISLIALRSWTFAITKIKEGATVQITSLRSILGYSANLIAMGIIAISVQLWGSGVYFILMLVASGLILTTLFTTINKIPLQKPKSTEKSFKKLDITWTKTAKLLVNSSFIDGLCKGLFVPFIILMLVDLGLTENKAV